MTNCEAASPDVAGREREEVVYFLWFMVRARCGESLLSDDDSVMVQRSTQNPDSDGLEVDFL